MFSKINIVLTAFVAVMFFSCSSDNDPVKEEVKSAAREITAFTFTNFEPAITGTIDQNTKTINVTVPNGVDVTALVPTIAISEKAHISPSSGAAVNFTNSVYYTVTAEDGSQQSYTVAVKRSTAISFTVNPLPYSYVEQDAMVVITGSNFRDQATNKLVFSNASASFEVPLEYLSSTEMQAKMPANAALGSYYTISVYNGYEMLSLQDNYSVIRHRPVITSISKTSVNHWEQVVIEGKYFYNLAYQVSLFNDNNSFRLDDATFTETSITFAVPPMNYESYRVKIRAVREDVVSEAFIKVVPTEAAPVIHSINTPNFEKGETLIINGANFKHDGLRTYVALLAEDESVVYVGEGTVNAAGTQITYPMNIAGRFRLRVELDTYGSTRYTFSQYHPTYITVTE